MINSYGSEKATPRADGTYVTSCVFGARARLLFVALRLYADCDNGVEEENVNSTSTGSAIFRHILNVVVYD